MALGEKAAGKDIKEVQDQMRRFIDGNMPREELKRGEWRAVEKAIIRVQTLADLEKVVPQVVEMADKATRRVLSLQIRGLWNQIKSDKRIAVDQVRECFKVLEDHLIGDRVSVEGPRDKTKAIAERLKMQAIVDKAMFGGPIKDLTDREKNALRSLVVTPISEKTTAELQELRDALKSLQEGGRFVLKARRAIMRSKADQAAADIVDAGLAPKKEWEHVTNLDGPDTKEYLKNKISDLGYLVRYEGDNISPSASVMLSMTGGRDPNHPLLQVFDRTVNTAHGRFSLGYNRLLKENFENRRENGIGAREDRRIGIQAALDDTTGSGRQKLLNRGMTEEQIDSMPPLTAKEQARLDWMRANMDPEFERASYIAEHYYNIHVSKVDFYFPQKTEWDGGTAEDFYRSLLPDASTRQATRGESTGTTQHAEQGFMKERVGPGQQPIAIDSNQVFLRHMREIIYYNEMEPVLKELGDIMKVDQFREAMGSGRLAYLQRWMDVVARNGGVPISYRMPAVDRLVAIAGMAKLVFVPSTALLHFQSTIAGAGYNGLVKQTVAAAEVYSSLGLRKAIYEASPHVRFMIGDDPAYHGEGMGTTLRKVSAIGFWPLKTINRMSAAVNWWAAYKGECAKRGVSPDLGDGLNDDAAYYADHMATRISGSGYSKDQALMLSSGTITPRFRHKTLARMITQYKSPIIFTYDRVRRDVFEGATKDPKKAASVLMAFLAATAAIMAVRAVCRHFLQPDKEKAALKHPDQLQKEMRKILEGWGVEDARGMAALTDEFGMELIGQYPFAGNIEELAGVYGPNRTGMPLVDSMFDTLWGAGRAVRAGASPREHAAGKRQMIKGAEGFIPGSRAAGISVEAGKHAYDTITGND